MTEEEFYKMLFERCPKVFSVEFRFGIASISQRYKVNDVFLPTSIFQGTEDDEFRSWLVEMDFSEEDAKEIRSVVLLFNRSYRKDYVVPFRKERRKV